MFLRAIALFTLAGTVPLAAAQITAVPRLDNRATGAAHSVAATLLLPDDTPSRSIALGALSPAETAKAAASASPGAAREGKPGAPLRIGIARSVPASAARIRLDQLAWQPAADGGTAAQLVLTSDGAAALRLGMTIADAPPGLVLRFRGSGATAETFGPVAASTMPAAYPYWSPALAGERAVVELALPAGAKAGDATLQLPMISHLVANPASSKAAADPYYLSRIGAADSCEVDVACVTDPSPALLDAQSSVARVLFTVQGVTTLCSGTLVNDSIGSKSGYVYVANHCIEDRGAPDDVLAASVQAAEAAGSTNSYWLFHAAECGSLDVPAYALLTGGAKLLARSVDYDWALLQLNEAAPPGATFSAWRAEPLATGANVSVLHHPRGDLTKYSVGTVTGYTTYSDGSTYVNAHWTQGAMEPGSGGSGLSRCHPTAAPMNCAAACWSPIRRAGARPFPIRFRASKWRCRSSRNTSRRTLRPHAARHPSSSSTTRRSTTIS
jgi:lysyl endopeptidase